MNYLKITALQVSLTLHFEYQISDFRQAKLERKRVVFERTR